MTTDLPQLLLLLLVARTSHLPPTQLLTSGWGVITLRVCVALILWSLVLQSPILQNVSKRFHDWKDLLEHKVI